MLAIHLEGADPFSESRPPAYAEVPKDKSPLFRAVGGKRKNARLQRSSSQNGDRETQNIVYNKLFRAAEASGLCGMLKGLWPLRLTTKAAMQSPPAA